MPTQSRQAFVYNLQYVQDLTANETRLVNRFWQFT